MFAARKKSLRAGSMGAAALCAVAIFAACGRGGSVPLSPARSSAALLSAGWTVRPAAGMAPLAGGRQLAWFDVRSPQGAAVSLQFLESAGRARREVTLATGQSTGFHGSVIDNVLVFVSPDGRTAIPDSVLITLRSLLHRS